MRRNYAIRLGVFIVAFVFAVLLAGSLMYSGNIAFAADEGLDFIANSPTVTTQYKQGEGTVTFVPATAEERASIILENATIYANKEVRYRPQDFTYAGIAFSGDVDVVLKGNNTIYLNNDNSSAGLFVYDGNAYISGDGSLFVGYDANYETDRTIYPIQVLGDLDVFQGKAEGTFADSGNLTINDGNITLDSKNSFSTGCLYAHNKITINGGTINTIGNSNAVYSNYSNIEINGGTVICRDFRYYGLMARGGDVSVSGDNTKVELLGSEDWTSSVGIGAGEKGYGNGNVYISGGETKIDAGSMGIQASADGFVSDVSISGGKLEIIASLNTSIVTGIYNTGMTKITGGEITITTAGDVDQAISIWSQQGIEVDGGITTLTADTQRENKFVCGIYTPGTIDITNGVLVAQGKMQALYGNVAVGEGLYAFGSTQMSGENREEFVSENLANYKYLRIADEVIEKIELSSENVKFEPNKTYKITSKIFGTGDMGEIVWTIQGATSKNTLIDQNGNLTIGKDEKAREIVIVATSSKDPVISAYLTIQVEGNDTLTIVLSVILGVVCLVLIVFFVLNYLLRKHKRKKLIKADEKCDVN